MVARAETSVFWPGITRDIQSTRDKCNVCNKMSPSQPQAPPIELRYPQYPFQMVCADYFSYKGKTYLVIVDRYSNWPIVERANDGSKGLIDYLRRTFSTFGVPDELSSDGGMEFMSRATQKFLNDWGVHHRVSSVAFPHSNCRAEIGVKTAKRIISDNTDQNGNLDVDAFQRAILVFRNTPDPETKLSPANCIFGRPIKDFIPIRKDRYNPHPTWIDALDKREQALRNRHQRLQEVWSEHSKALPPLKVGDHVRVQNQVGQMPRRWDRTGIVVEVRQFDQYVIKMDGSSRVSLRNRRFLRKYEPMFAAKQPSSIRENVRLVKTSSPVPSFVKTPQHADTENQLDVFGGSETPDSAPAESVHDRPCEVHGRTSNKVALALRRLDPFNKPGLRE